MPVPKRKRSRQRRDKRFANKGLKVGQIGLCLSCQEPIIAHQVCKVCGFYKGKKVIITKAERAERRTFIAEDRKKRLEVKAQPTQESLPNQESK